MRGIEAIFRRIRKTGHTGRRRSAAAQTVALLLSALALPLAACNAGLGGQAGGASLAPNQTFTWPYVTSTGQFGHNEVLDPAEVATGEDTGTLSMLYIGLVTYGPNLSVVPDAARTWDIDPTGTIYTFHLRSKLFFSDGKPITAADFAYSIDRALDPNLCPVDSAKTYNANGECAQVGATYLSHILGAGDRLTPGGTSTIIANGDDPRKGLNVLDAQTLRIRLDAPISYFLQALTYPDADVLEKSFVQTPAYAGGLWVDHLDKGGTSGPFMLKSYGDGSKMTFVPNPYWEKAFGQQLMLSQVIRPAIASFDSEYSNYRAGAFDYTDVPEDQYRFARGQNDFHSVPALETDYFGLNTKLAPFDNIYVRQAFDLALNKQLMVDNVEFGGAIPTNHIVPQGMPGFNVGLTNPTPDNTQSLTSNVPAALSLLKKAQASCPTPDTIGAPDYCAYITGPSPLAIVVYVRNDKQVSSQLAQQAITMWSSALGLNVQFKKIAWYSSTQPSLVGYVLGPQKQNPMQMWEIGWIADYNDPQDWLTILFSTGAPYNAEGFSDPKLDALMAKADVEQNASKRMQMYNQAEQAIVDACAWIPFQQPKLYWRQRAYVHGFGFNTIGLMTDINWSNVYIAAH